MNRQGCLIRNMTHGREDSLVPCSWTSLRHRHLTLLHLNERISVTCKTNSRLRGRPSDQVAASQIQFDLTGQESRENA